MGHKEKGNAVLVAVFCVLSLPVLSNGFDLPFLTEAKRRDQQTETDAEQNNRGLLSELLPSSRVNAVPKGDLLDIMRANSPPKHIVKLLQKMSRDQDLLQRRGNTVRSVVPMRKNTCGRDTFIFSLRTLEVTEQLDAIELHYFVRKLKKWSKNNLRLNVQFHQIDNNSICYELGALQLPPDMRGWQTLNMTSYIERLLNETSPKIRIGVTFTVTTDRPRPKMTAGTLVRKILSKHVQPFMLVYTEDKMATETDSSELSWQRLAKDLSGRSKDTPRRRRTRSVSNVVTNNSYSLMTNEFPENYDITNVADATFPFFAEQNSRRRKAKKKEKEKKEKQRRNRNKNKNGKHSKKGPLLDQQSGESEEIEENRNENIIQTSKMGVCSRQHMRVDFNTIGWDEYVIAPEGFDAYYCAGQCPFPLAKELNPSNHAAIQSVVSALGAIPNVPAPCCVPDKMSPISILFFDEDNNVGLKSYQNMQVDSCSCR